jgi:hypothetical protein
MIRTIVLFVKHMLSRNGNMLPPLRVDEICRMLSLDFADLARLAVEAQPLMTELALAPEAAVVADRKVLLVAICCPGKWTLDRIVDTYTVTETECAKHRARKRRPPQAPDSC